MECICVRDCYHNNVRYKPGDRDDFEKVPKHFVSVAESLKQAKAKMKEEKSELDRAKDKIIALGDENKALKAKVEELGMMIQKAKG